jgi:hypothetical protein
MQSKRRLVKSSGILLALAVVGAGGCSGRSVRHDPSQAGTGAVGGAAISTGGAGVTAQGGTGARTNGSSGHGGSAGRATAGTGGASRGGAAGTGGAASGAGGSGMQPHCECTSDDFGFDCEVALDSAANLSVPQNCENDLNYLRRSSCDDGSTHYEWLVGDENDHEVFVDANGNVIYFSSSGYVGRACDDPAEQAQYGSYRGGTKPDARCTSECTVCENLAPDEESTGPSCAVCTPLANDRTAVSLADYCAFTSCPENIRATRADITFGCGEGVVDADMTESCGTVTVRAHEGERRVSYFFDAETAKLTGMLVVSDDPAGPCHARATEVGTLPTACALESDCSLCDAAGGAAGAAGTGGLGAGAPSGSALPACAP